MELHRAHVTRMVRRLLRASDLRSADVEEVRPTLVSLQVRMHID
jgi:hypothetical protein